MHLINIAGCSRVAGLLFFSILAVSSAFAEETCEERSTRRSLVAEPISEAFAVDVLSRLAEERKERALQEIKSAQLEGRVFTTTAVIANRRRHAVEVLIAGGQEFIEPVDREAPLAGERRVLRPPDRSA